MNNSNIRFIATNKSRVEDWLKVNRLQLPLPNSQSDSAYRVSQFINAKNLDVTSEIEIATPSISIIPPTDEKINISDEKNSTPLYEATPDVTHQDNVAHAHYESEDVNPKKENGALDKGASDKE